MCKKVKTLLIRLVYHKHLQLAVFIIAAISASFSSFLIYTTATSHDMLEVDFLDIGQGDSLYIHAPNGNSLILDGGSAAGQAVSKVGAVTNMFDTQIDVVVATHADADHIGGFANVLQHYGASLFVYPAFSGNTLTYKNLLNTVSTKSIPRIVARKGLEIVLDDKRHIVLTILYPNNQFPIYKYEECEKEKAANKHKSRKKCEKKLILDTNESSIVARLTYGTESYLLTADAPINVEHFLMSTLPKTLLSSTVLKVGHHGSKTSTGPDFVKAVNPSTAAISVGAGNKYGHPHAEALQNLHENMSVDGKILRTDQMGTIQCLSDGQTTTCRGMR